MLMAMAMAMAMMVMIVSIDHSCMGVLPIRHQPRTFQSYRLAPP
jgi:hypothetical protein